MSSSILSGGSLRHHDLDDDDKPPVPVRVRTMDTNDGQGNMAEGTDAEQTERHHVRFSAASPEVFPDVPDTGAHDGQRLDTGIDREELIKAIVKMQLRASPIVDTTVAENTADESAASNVDPVDHKTGEDPNDKPYDTKLYPSESIDEDDPEAQDKCAHLPESSNRKNEDVVIKSIRALPRGNDSDMIASIMEQRMFTENSDYVASVYHDGDPRKAGSSLPWWRNKRILIALAVLVVAALAIGIGVGVSSSKSSSTPSSVLDTPAQEPSSGPTSAPGPVEPTSSSGPVVEPGNVTQFRELLYPLSGEALDDPQSPQARAFNWITSETVARSPEDIEARYVSATVYYSLGGEAWVSQYNFLSQNDVCTWNDAGDNGILCTDGDITELNLRKSIVIHQS